VRRSFPRLVATLLALLPIAGCTTASKLDLPRVLTAGRDGWQHPERVVEALELAPGERVAEIGAGSGYWLPWLSEAVGPDGRVFAVEVEPALVEALRERVAREQLDNVEVILGRYEDPLLPDGEVDVAMTSLTYHHIEERPAYFGRLRGDLSPRGRDAHLDGRDDLPIPFRWLASRGHSTDPEAMRAEMQEAGYRRVSLFDFLPMETVSVFVPDALETTSR
jgi:SAM-dependent methyltransferase